MPVKNYSFGASAPTSNRNKVLEQMWLAHRYRNKLVELELNRRKKVQAILASLSPGYAAAAQDVAAAEQAVEDLYAELKRQRSLARKRLQASPELAEQIAAAKRARAEAYAAHKAAQKDAFQILESLRKPHMQAAEEAVAADPGRNGSAPATRKRHVRSEYLRRLVAAGVDDGQEEFERLQKEARANNGLYWGTYLIVEDAASKFGSGPPPRFKAWGGRVVNGEIVRHNGGTVAVQLMGGLKVSDAIGGSDTRLRLEIPCEEELAQRGKSRGERSEGTMWIRVGSEGRAPIWCIVPVRFHRPLPQNGVIRWAYLECRVVCEVEQWSVRLTVESEEPAPAKNENTTAVHLGYRKMQDSSLRVATILGPDGAEKTVSLSAELCESQQLRDHLQGVRDEKLNAITQRLAAWIRGRQVPEWLAESNVGQIQSQAKLRAIVDYWREHRFDGDEELWESPPEGLSRKDLHDWHKHRSEYLPESWRKQDKHLQAWIDNSAKKVIAKRNLLYREVVAELAKECGEAVAMRVNWKEIAENPEPDAKSPAVRNVNRQARFGAVGVLMQYLREKFGARLIEVSPENLTATCNACGSKESFDRLQLMHCCRSCGETWDQDANAVRNMLARAAVLKKRQEVASPCGKSDLQDGSDAAGGVKKETARKARRNRKAPSK